MINEMYIYIAFLIVSFILILDWFWFLMLQIAKKV